MSLLLLPTTLDLAPLPANAGSSFSCSLSVNHMCVVLFEYYEYSSDGEFLGLNQADAEFDTLDQAEAYASELRSKDDVKKVWIS